MSIILNVSKDLLMKLWISKDLNNYEYDFSLISSSFLLKMSTAAVLGLFRLIFSIEKKTALDLKISKENHTKFIIFIVSSILAIKIY